MDTAGQRTDVPTHRLNSRTIIVMMVMTVIIISALLLCYILLQRHQIEVAMVMIVMIIVVLLVGYKLLHRNQIEGVHAPRLDQEPRLRNPRHQEAEPPLDDRTLSEVATRLGCDWVKLAVELSLPLVQVQTIERNHQNDITRQGLDMLVTWQQAQSTSVEQQMTTLCTALENIGRADIARFLHDSPQPTGTIGNIHTVSGSNNPIIVGSSAANINYSFPLEEPGSPQPTGNIGNSGTVSGSNNPIIAGLSGVNINYNFQSEGPGVRKRRPLHSQRPDKEEPSMRIPPSYQGAGNKTRAILKGVYKTTGSYVQLLPGVDTDQRHKAGIYTKVQLETREGVEVTGQKGEALNSTEYAKIFRLRTQTGELIKRLIFFGMGGVGKTTMFDKIAYDWADAACEILNRFKLVFLLKMCALSQESDLVDSIFDQLLGEDSGIAKDELDRFILANPNEVLILLDGFDEMRTKRLNAASFGSILKALNRTEYKECIICITTRPSHLETLISETLVQNPCIHVEVLGFTDEDVSDYVRKFYDKDPDSGNALIQTIVKSNTLREFAKTPMLLLLMCLLWRESNQLPETTSRLFTEAIDHMFTRKHISGEDGSKIVISIGQTALHGLMSANQKFSFQEYEFEPRALDLALRAGILTKQRVIKNSKSHNNIQFMHKTMQEYCAAKYLQSVHRSNQGFFKRKVYKVVPIGEFQNSVMQLCQTIEGVVSNEFLLRFCCGDNEKCMTDIVNLLDRNFSKDKPRYQSHVIQAISRNCFFESQSSNFHVLRFLTRDSHIPSTIEVRNNNDFRHLMYLLEVICRSDSCTAQLARVETIQVSSVSSVSDVAFALGYMENLRALRLDKCPLVMGDLEKTLSSLKCNQQLTSLDIVGCDTLGGTAIEWAPHIKHLTSLNTLRLTNCELQITDIEHIASAVRDMPKLTDLYLHGHRLGGLQSLFPSHIRVHSS